jgi:transcriptional regulator with XRE-family HTH domain
MVPVTSRDPIVRALVHRRIDLGLTQTDVGSRMGMPQNAVSRFERSDNPWLATVKRYAEAVEADLFVVARPNP